MIQFIIWYLLLTIAGLISFPLVFVLFPGLPGRGYAFARIFGLLVWGYTFWILASFGVLKNDLGSMLFALGIVLLLSVLAGRKITAAEVQEWWARRRRMVLLVELVFLIAFGSWTLIRAMNPEITATEKPMELAFLNAILRSPNLPPNDPWLSGYAISYYYFGYVLVAMLATLTGVPAGIAFNLGIAAIFGLSAVGAYGLVYALLEKGRIEGERASNPLYAVLGPLFVLLVSNLEGFLDMLHARGLFWRLGPDGSLVSGFWSWLDLKDLVNPPVKPFSWMPERFLWWWRASRVVNDVGFNGGQQEVIDEFPFFSFLLSDLHPHVMAIPFVLLAVALALNHFFRAKPGRIRIAGRSLEISAIEFLTVSLVLGGLAFLNTWDFPIYVALFTGAVILRQVQKSGWRVSAVVHGAGAAVLLGAAGVLLYFPFYVGFSSQAGGILPNVINPTRGAHLWVMFGSLFVPILIYMVYSARRTGWELSAGLKWGFGIVLGLWGISLLIVLAVGLFPETAGEAIRAFGAPDAGSLLREAFARRLSGFGGWFTLAVMLAFGVALLLRKEGSPVDAFVMMLVIVGLLLVIVPEFLYLRDLFGVRMNTIFKFYYQAWILLGIAAAYGSAVVIRRWRGAAGSFAAAAIAGVVLMALVYPALSLYEKTNGFRPSAGLNLDGTVHGAYLSADDRAAVAWLDSAPLGVLLEAVGGSYSSGGRIATHTGQPGVLGWVFHEGQWRGGYTEVGTREGDIERIYETGNWEEARELVDRYGVTYIYVGTLERTTYRVNEAKFRRNLPVLFEQGGVVIYGYLP